jgi:hypothetical protein
MTIYPALLCIRLGVWVEWAVASIKVSDGIENLHQLNTSIAGE